MLYIFGLISLLLINNIMEGGTELVCNSTLKVDTDLVKTVNTRAFFYYYVHTILHLSK